LQLAAMTSHVISNALQLLGIRVPQRM
ncbi:MAG: hypothetical protein KGM98_06815, partial [Bacteroidota bacterium]|nr:hypothetical protein [Bacteroidota bacterium]